MHPGTGRARRRDVTQMEHVAKPTQRQLLAELGDVARDLPAFLTAPLYRGWHLRWGATPAETAASLPGDALVPHAQFKATRAITIDAPPEAVWPWLVQAGCQRAGFYSNDLLDNLGHPSAHHDRSPPAAPADRPVGADVPGGHAHRPHRLQGGIV